MCLLSCDIDLARDGDGIRFGLYSSATLDRSGGNPKMSDSSGKIDNGGIPSGRGRRFCGVGSQVQFSGRRHFGTETLPRAFGRREEHCHPYNELELDGYEIDQFATRKWPYIAMKAPGAVARTKVPRAGRYHAGFIMYDDAADERVVISVGDEIGACGRPLGTRRTGSQAARRRRLRRRRNGRLKAPVPAESTALPMWSSWPIHPSRRRCRWMLRT